MKQIKNKLSNSSLRNRFSIFIGVCLVLVLSSCGVSRSLKDQPLVSQYNVEIPKRIKVSDSLYTVGKNQLRKNKQGLWELYIEGDPLERGLANGSLTQELLQKQEAIFFSKVEELVPSKSKQYLLRKFLAWFNRKLYLHIKDEYKTEIYGVSRYASNAYDYIANDYLRSLYLHGAHDIGHALKDLALVGCSSFAVWGENSADNNLLIARNFDFYAGDDFAKEKIIAFVKPDNGFKYISVTWGGMIGVVSGMNDQGLTVTINAGRSDIPLVAKTPISILTREILQYASNIDEAVVIAKKREVFVAEAILVGSAKDGKAVTIEVSPNNFGVFEVTNSSQMICSNHFQSTAYADDKKNKKHKLESHSQYRYDRMTELLKEEKVTPKLAVDILRNREGLADKKIGYGNEKALNQLLAHHAIVFKPTQLKVWISSNPYQLGEFVSYDLNTVFEKFEHQNFDENISDQEFTIPKDEFINTKAFKKYEEYRKLRHQLIQIIDSKGSVSVQFLEKFKYSNPDYWETYYLVGNYYYKKGYYKAALNEFNRALTKEVTTVPDKEQLKKYIKKIKRN